MWVCGVDVARDSTIELNVLFNYVLVLKTVGLLLGVLMGDFLYDYTNSLTWSLSCSGFLCLPMIPTLFWYMPETLPLKLRKPFTSSEPLNAFASLKEVFKRIGKDRTLKYLLLVTVVLNLATSQIQTIALYWGQWKFGWSTTTQAIFIELSIVATLLGSLAGPWLFLGVVAKNCTDTNYARMAIAMVSIAALSSIFLTLSTTSYGVMISICFYSFGTGFIPALSAQISARANDAEQGQIQGISYGLTLFSRAVGVYAYWGLFEVTINDDDKDDNTNQILGSTIWIFSGCLMIAIIMLELEVTRLDSKKIAGFVSSTGPGQEAALP